MRSTIGLLASSPVVTVEIDSFVCEGLALMCARNVSSLIVLSEGRPVGILTERDIVFAANWMLGQSDLRVGEVMNKQVMIVNEGMTVVDVWDIFQGNSIRHLVVVDNQERMKGIFTRTGLVQILDKQAFPEINDVSELMSRKVWHVSPETPTRYALSLMARHAISAVLVMDAMRPVGFFTEKDVVRLITSGRDLTTCSVGEASMSPVLTISERATPVQAIALMNREAVRRLLILDQSGAIAGVLTQTDLSHGLDGCSVPVRLSGSGVPVASTSSDKDRVSP